MARALAASEVATLLQSSGQAAECFFQIKVPRALTAISPVKGYQSWLDRRAAKNALILQQKSWGVTWPGHIDTRTCAIDTAAIGDAFMAWGNFRLVGGYGLGVLPIAGPLEDKLRTATVTFLSELRSDVSSLSCSSQHFLEDVLQNKMPKLLAAVDPLIKYEEWLKLRALRKDRLRSQQPWGVDWPGHPDKRTCSIDTSSIVQALSIWSNLFTFPHDACANSKLRSQSCLQQRPAVTEGRGKTPRFVGSLVSRCKCMIRASDQAIHTYLWIAYLYSEIELLKIWSSIKARYRQQVEQRTLRTTQLSQKSWGVDWPGHADRRTCAVDTHEISKALGMWNKLQLVDPESWANHWQAKRGVPVVPQTPDSELTEQGRLHKLTFEVLNRH